MNAILLTTFLLFGGAKGVLLTPLPSCDIEGIKADFKDTAQIMEDKEMYGKHLFSLSCITQEKGEEYHKTFYLVVEYKGDTV